MCESPIVSFTMPPVIQFTRTEVDCAGRRIGIDHGRRAAAHDFDVVDGFIETEGLVGIQVAERRIMLPRGSARQRGRPGMPRERPA
jgi:hypothetical protein